MKFKTLMIFKALVCLILGLPILFVPTFFYGLFGTTLSAGGVFAAREYGASLIGNMLLAWIARNAKESDARRGIIWGLFVYDAIGVVIALIATLTGVLSFMGWAAVAIYLLIALGFGYFLLRSPKP
jgi:hypothetical protein